MTYVAKYRVYVISIQPHRKPVFVVLVNLWPTKLTCMRWRQIYMQIGFKSLRQPHRKSFSWFCLLINLWPSKLIALKENMLTDWWSHYSHRYLYWVSMLQQSYSRATGLRGENSLRVVQAIFECYKTFCVLYGWSNASAIDCTAHMSSDHPKHRNWFSMRLP